MFRGSFVFQSGTCPVLGFTVARVNLMTSYCYSVDFKVKAFTIFLAATLKLFPLRTK